MAAEKSSKLNIPIKLIFNEEGINFFMKNQKKLNKFRMADNTEAYGVLLENFSFPTVKHLINIGYVSELEVAETELSSSRQEITDLSKMIVYSLLYHRFDQLIFQKLIKSDMVIKWNRANPSSIIDEKTRFNDSYLEGVLDKIKGKVKTIKKDILGPIYNSINANNTMLPDEKNIQLLLSEKYVNNLRPLTYFILARNQESLSYKDLIREIRNDLSLYIERAKISEYFSLMILELITYSENAQFQRYAKKLYKGTVDPKNVMYDSALRQRILEELIMSDEKVYLSMKIGSRSTSINTTHKLDVTLYNKSSEFRAIKDQINDKKGLNLKEKSLMEFYTGLSDGAANTELGLYYLSYLSDACKKVNIRFESNVHQIPSSDLTMIDLLLQF